jgi:hypothetical protein
MVEVAHEGDRRGEGARRRLDRRRLLAAGGAVTAGAVGATVLGASPAAAAPLVPVLAPALPPERLYDSREGGGEIGSGVVRELTGDPVDLYAFLMNVTVVNTSGFGWLTIYEAGTALPDTSNINWYGSDQTIVNNCYTWLRPSDSGIEVACGGAGSTHFLLDLIGVLFDYDPGSALTAQAGAVPASLGGRRLTGTDHPGA